MWVYGYELFWIWVLLSALGSLKVILALLCWAMSLPLLLVQPAAQGFTDAAVLIFLAILLLSMVRLRRQSLMILLALITIGWLILPQLPSVDQLRQAGSFVLIFACLLPTLTLVRATALTMPSVLDTNPLRPVAAAEFSFRSATGQPCSGRGDEYWGFCADCLLSAADSRV